MSFEHTRATDLNGLYLLSVLLKECHISRAAQRCFLTQPAMSRALDRLRRDFQDELLVRSGRKYERTPRADRLLAELDRILPQIEDLFVEGTQNLLASVEVIRLTMNDHACAVLLPQILRRLWMVAPNLHVEVRPFSDRRFDEVQAGQTDLLFDVSGAPGSLETETLYVDDFVCVVSSDHPVVSEVFSLEDYLKYRHIVVTVLEGEQTLVDRTIQAKGLYRQIGLTLPYFVPALLMVPGTDLILTVPRQLTHSVPLGSQVRLLAPPTEMASFQYQMVWHRLVSEDRVHRWLREQIRSAVGFLHSWSDTTE